MKKAMEQYIKANFPEAVFDHYLATSWGTEYIFYPTPDADEPYSCIPDACGGFAILTEF